ncbi:MAG: FAD-dependent oxidoreductase [Pyrinomonadaceae bacterium]
MANILILGGGFGGLITAEKLAASIGSQHQITLVSPSPKFTFYPALVELAFGKCERDEITFDLRMKLDEIKVRFVQGEIVRHNADRRTVQTAGPDFEGEIGYDYLVIAVGRRLATERVPGFFEYAHHLLGAGAALKFGDAVRGFRSGRIIVGGCPESRLPVPVCEVAFALARQFAAGIRSGETSISVIFPDSLREAFGGADIHTELETAFKTHGINVLYDIPICEITPDEVFSSDKHKINYDLLMLVPPFRGNAVFRHTCNTDDADFLEVDGYMRVQGQERTYAVGDIAAFPGPKFAHMAVRQAGVAAANIISEIKGEQPNSEYYHEIATVIDAGGAESIYLHYGIWDETHYKVKKGRFWSWAKDIHDTYWRARHS